MSLKIANNVSLSPHTTFQTGGEARCFVTVTTEPELLEAITYAKENELDRLVIGGGSNLLISDNGFPGLVIKMSIEGMDEIKKDNTVLVTAGAGMVFDDLIERTVEHGWWGLENLSHIPGSVGATPVQNVGAYGVEVSSLITKVRVLDIESENFVELSPKECEFAYRHSIFKTDIGRRYVITAVTFQLSLEPKPQISYADLRDRFAGRVPNLSEVREAVIDIRSHKFPDWQVVGTAGSFFKNPIIERDHYDKLLAEYPDLPGYDTADNKIKIPLGWILDKALGVRGRREGAVGCYAGQALVLVNFGGADTTEIVKFAKSLANEVEKVTGIKIEHEVTFVGE